MTSLPGTLMTYLSIARAVMSFVYGPLSLPHEPRSFPALSSRSFPLSLSSLAALETSLETPLTPDASQVNAAKDFVHEVDIHLDALIDNAERALKGDYTPNPNSKMAPVSPDAEAQGAYNEETGEINWDCPCLGGMATGPCGEEFKAAFSCFVHSSQEPKGMDCIEQFKGMQDCFRRHPETYGEEITEMDNEGPA